MSDIVVQAVGLSKRYRIGRIQPRYRTLRETIIERASAPWSRLRRAMRGQPVVSSDESIWALKDVSFEIKRGEVVGIIGRNGAGKTTVLKVLSRITKPTKGYVDLDGRVGSLLEVGTGFHPELTGRENTYLNGAILGMKKAEIERKFDEIVAFAEIERFIDTPTKHFSTGMSVRLAFAVAAYLEPEILLVDEVLAVGDAGFQKKCLRKMSDVSREGRTVIFVSHNMAAVANLCETGILLDYGRLVRMGSVQDVVQEYLALVEERGSIGLANRLDRKGDGRVRIAKVSFMDGEGNRVEYLQSGMDAEIVLHYETFGDTNINDVSVSIGIDTIWGQRLCTLQSEFVGSSLDGIDRKGRIICRVPRFPLAAGIYPFTLFVTAGGEVSDWVIRAGEIRVEAGDFYGTGRYPEPQDGDILVDHYWRHSAG